MALEELNIVVEHWKCDHCRRHSQSWNLNLIYTLKYRNFKHKICFCYHNGSECHPSGKERFSIIIVVKRHISLAHFVVPGNKFFTRNLLLEHCAAVRAHFSGFVSCSVFLFFLPKKEEKRVNKNTISSSFYRRSFHFLLQQNPHPQGALVKKSKAAQKTGRL